MDAESFDRLYVAHAADLLRFLTYKTADGVLAEDLVAETFVRAYKGRRGFDRRRASEKTWLYTIALNCLRDHARHEGVQRRALEGADWAAGGAAGDWAETITERDALLRAMATLSDEEREVVALRYGADLALEEIARVLGTRRSTVEGRLYRGLRRMRAQLEPAGPEEAPAPPERR
ncbi:MAG TPA: RNA polymerase sigma factor [Solirubrobacteraceae bacterium]